MILILGIIEEHNFLNYLINGPLRWQFPEECGNISVRLKPLKEKKKEEHPDPTVLHVSSSLAIPGKRKAHHHHHDYRLSDHRRKCLNLR